jgi:hypothetical protein
VREAEAVKELRPRAAQRLAEAVRSRSDPLLAHCDLGLGMLYRRTGERAKAEEHLSSARAMCREFGMGFWLEKAAASPGLHD